MYPGSHGHAAWAAAPVDLRRVNAHPPPRLETNKSQQISAPPGPDQEAPPWVDRPADACDQAGFVQAPLGETANGCEPDAITVEWDEVTSVGPPVEPTAGPDLPPSEVVLESTPDTADEWRTMGDWLGKGSELIVDPVATQHHFGAIEQDSNEELVSQAVENLVCGGEPRVKRAAPGSLKVPQARKHPRKEQKQQHGGNDAGADPSWRVKDTNGGSVTPPPPTECELEDDVEKARGVTVSTQFHYGRWLQFWGRTLDNRALLRLQLNAGALFADDNFKSCTPNERGRGAFAAAALCLLERYKIAEGHVHVVRGKEFDRWQLNRMPGYAAQTTSPRCRRPAAAQLMPLRISSRIDTL